MLYNGRTRAALPPRLPAGTPDITTSQRGASMPVTIPCPSCGAKLRIPDTAVGKKVKCSKCSTAFTAEPPDEEAEPAAIEAPAPAPPPPRKPAPPPVEE